MKNKLLFATLSIGLIMLNQTLIANSQDNYKNAYANISEDDESIKQVKSNMLTVSTVLETYSIDWGGVYPQKVSDLVKEAKKLKYWKDIFNPYTFESGTGKNGVVSDMQVLKDYGEQKSLRGLVIVDVICESEICTQYKIYGLDSNGKLIYQNGSVFKLTND